MLFFQTKGYQFHFLIIICLLKKSLITSEEINFGQGKYNFIYIQDKIIGIKNSTDDFNIYYYDETEKINKIIGNYSGIISNKDIIKKDNDYFIIVGFDGDNKFKYIINKFPELTVQKNEIVSEVNIDPPNTIKFNFLCLSSNQICFMSFIQNSNFNIYKIELDSSKSYEINIQNDNSLNVESGYLKNNIQCESSKDGDFLFCILSWNKGSEWLNKYVYLNAEENPTITNGIICQYNCFLGNIKRVDDSENKYLICYEQLSNNKINIYCQYYYIQNDGVKKDGNPTNITELQVGINSPYEKPLSIYLYKNSILIENYFISGSGYVGVLVISSLDLKISMKISKISNCRSTGSFFNNDIYYYNVYYNSESETFITKGSFYTCSDKEYFIKNNEQSISLDDLFNDKVGKYFGFSLKSGIKISENNIYLNFDDNSFNEIKSGKNYKLNKEIENGILNNNYYSYGEFAVNNFMNTFSLICQMKVIICYKTCKNCNSNLVPNSANHYCTECDLTDYFPITKEKTNNPNGYNCYSPTDEKVSNYYLDNKAFLPCDYSCKSCNNSNSCNFCKEEFYFKAYENNTIIFEDKCTNKIPESYYLDFDANIKVQNEIIKSVYKPCYKTCKSCIGPGKETENSCTSCKDGYISYEFNKQQCSTNYSTCLDKKQYWKLENNNIICVTECSQSIVISGENKGQCVENCNNYINPFSIEQTGFILPYQCEDSNYCIPYDDCFKGSFYVSEDGKSCEREKRCIQIDIFNDSVDPFEVEPEEEEIPYDYDSKIENIYNRLKVTKILTDNKSDSKVLEIFNDLKIIQTYNTLLLNEKSNGIANDIYLITSTRYINFTITIYPIDIEDFVYSQVIVPNSLGFINFTKLFPDYIYYEINNSKLILVCLMEHHIENSSINDLNYYLYSFNERNQGKIRNLGEKININESEEFILDESSKLETQFFLSNYINKSSLVNKRNSDYLVNNIKDFYSRYPEVELYNISDPFYTDICFLFTSDQGTDMTLDDRRKEYYVNSSLCEDNCILLKIINRDTEPRSLCSCDLKSNISLNNNEFKDDIKSYSVSNSKSFKCISETFNFNLAKNGNFWIFVFILIIQVYLLIICIKHRDTIINNMLGLFEVNSSLNKLLIASNSDGSNFTYEYKKNKIKFSNNNHVNSNDKIESQQEEILSAPINVSNPPKRKVDLKKPNNTSTKTDIKIEEKDLISGNESSIIKGSTIKFEKNPQEFTDISFEDIQEGYETLQVDNLLIEQKGYMLKDNYLKDPLIEERLKKMKKIKKSLRPINIKDRFNTCEDVLYSNSNEEKFNNKRNKKITKILGGKEIFKNYLIENYSDDEKKPRYPKTKIKDEVIETDNGLIEDGIKFPGKIKSNCPFLIDEPNNKHKIRITTNKNVEDLFGTENKNNNKNNINNTLAKSLGKKEINKLKDEGNSEERLKTEIEYDANNKIKNVLQDIGKGNNRPYSSVGIFGKNRKLSQPENNINKGQNPQSIKLKNKKIEKNNNINNKDSSKDSGKRILRFQEEEIIGDEAGIKISEDEEMRKKRRSRNLEILKSKIFFNSITEILETNNEEILVEENFILYYWKYFMRRELWLLAIINKKENIPYFIRYSSLAFCISFIFLLNCFFFFESDVHRRYISALNGKKKAYFKQEFGKTICVSLLGNLFKMIFIKLVIYKIFKIGKNAKRMMRASAENELNQNEIEELHSKRRNYLKKYKKYLLIYFICLMALNILFAYTCICYAGVFINSQGVFLLGLLLSLIFSFIFCAAICFLIVCLYRLGKYLENKCLISAYVVLSTLY